MSACKGCARVWGASGSEGQCSRCRRCLECCSSPRVKGSCVEKRAAMSAGAGRRSDEARERYHAHPGVLAGHRGRFER